MRRKRIITICMTIVLVAMLFLQGCGKISNEQSLQNQSDNTENTNDNTNNDSGVIEMGDEGNDEGGADNQVGDVAISDKSDSKNKDDNAVNGTNETNGTSETNDTNVIDPAKDTENVDTTSESTERNPYEATESVATAYPSTAGALHVEGTQLTDSHGNAIQLKGISTHGLASSFRQHPIY